MKFRPDIFISTTTNDLGTVREDVRDLIDTIDGHAVTQKVLRFSFRGIPDLLEDQVRDADAVVHIAGVIFGEEPKKRKPRAARRSYAQMEHDFAVALDKPLFIVVATPEFPFDGHDPEAKELSRLQESHRYRLRGTDHIYYEVRTREQLRELILTLPIEELREVALKRFWKKLGRRARQAGVVGTACLMVGAFGSAC